MTHGSLFSGIGGFDLAAEWAGWTNKFNCEIDPFCRKVLDYQFPNAEGYGNIKTTDFKQWRGRIDVLSGGFPCQPFSLAGKRKGTNDDRYLWPEMLRAIREIRPRWIVGENVYGFVNWSDGLVFETVHADLENEGYEVQPYILPACAVNAPHRRDRVWFVAHIADGADARLEGVRERAKQTDSIINAPDTYGNRFGQRTHKQEWGECTRASDVGSGGTPRLASNAEDSGLQSCDARPRTLQPRRGDTRALSCNFDRFPTQSPVCGRDDGISGELDGITFPKWRGESVKAYGNAVVPQLVLRIFETINEYENLASPA